MSLSQPPARPAEPRVRPAPRRARPTPVPGPSAAAGPRSPLPESRRAGPTGRDPSEDPVRKRRPAPGRQPPRTAGPASRPGEAKLASAKERPRAETPARERPRAEPPARASASGPSPSLLAAASQSSLVRRAEVVEGDGFVVEASDSARGAGIPALRTHFFESIQSLRARAVSGRSNRSLARRSVADVRGYAREDLLAIAEVAYHYLFNGGARLALVLYEGLAAVAPDEAYFALALGLTHDHLGHADAAHHWYEQAGRIDAAEPRADLNRAELFLQVGDRRRAQGLLERGLAKAVAAGETALERKARALLKHIAS